MKRAKIILILTLLTISYSSFAQLNKQAAEGLIKRIIPTVADKFIIEEIPAEGGKDVFELQSRGGKIILSGNNGLSIASALGYYLKFYCRCDFGWNGNNLKLPLSLPVIGKKIHRSTPYHYRYYLNYCTFNYSMSWWNWGRWQKEIDWMALHGINMPLALTGEEAIWQQVYKGMGFSDTELDDFFSGPAYFSWLWMGNMDGWGGPLPQHWIDSHKELQKKILERERSFGMTPVLPAFSGHVPPSFKTKYPSAKLIKTNWGQGFNDTYLLDPNDPMFAKIGKKFIEAQSKEYGTNHLYSSDTFNENEPPTSDSAFLNQVSKNIFKSMTDADPKAVWVMQGWLFYSDAKYWQPTQIKAVLNAVPDNQMVILDLYSDENPIWKSADSYYGKPWIWNMLQNFGGNLSLHGRLAHVGNAPNEALHQSKSMIGIGLTPEAIEQNPVMFELMMDNVWRDSPINVSIPSNHDENYTPGNKPWLTDYTERRYGKYLSAIDEAWQLMMKSVYTSVPPRSRGVASVIVARPGLSLSNNSRIDTVTNYNSKLLVKAWGLFIRSADELKNSDGFRYDLVDVTRQVLANYANALEPEIIQAYRLNDTAAFRKNTAEYLQLMDDMNELLSSRKDFLLGKWLNEARANGITPQESDLYEFNARDLITLWGGKDSPLHEYSNRQWAGLIKGFYKPRWEMFFSGLNQSLIAKVPFDDAAFQKNVKDLEWKWVNKHEKYTDEPTGNSIKEAQEMFEKYNSKIKAIYQ